MQFDLLLRNATLATFVDPVGFGLVPEAALGISRDRIAWLGPEASLPRGASAAREVDLRGRVAAPGLIDCHTHLVYAGNRAEEFEQRLNGVSYAAIARAGGGINATVRATRAASEADLVAQSTPRLAALVREGVTTVEIKSGYGLTPQDELKMLRASRRLGAETATNVATTLLAAHAVPPEFAGRPDEYIAQVCDETIPAAANAGLADAVDAFCETIAFTPAQTRRVFEAATRRGLRVKLHADQLSDLGGAALAAEFGACSADHLEFTSDEGVAALAAAGTVAVLLPGAFYALRETRMPPIAALHARGVPIAIATDCNPGTSPVTSITLIVSMACTLFRLTPAEALAGVTRSAARALGFNDRGVLAPGMRADIAAWDIGAPAELAYRIGSTPCALRIVGGVVTDERI